MTPPTIALLTATRSEMIALLARFSLRGRHIGRTVTMENVSLMPHVIGVGPEQAGRSVKQLISDHPSLRLVLAGLSGGLSPALSTGDVLSPRSVTDGRETLALPEDDQPPHVIADPIGPLILTQPTLAVDAATKRRLHEQHAADAVDMETFAVAQAAMDARVPLRVIRVILDDAHTTLPEYLSTWVAPDGRPRLGRVMRQMLRHPGRLRLGLRLQRETNQCMAAADKFVRQALR